MVGVNNPYGKHYAIDFIVDLPRRLCPIQWLACARSALHPPTLLWYQSPHPGGMNGLLRLGRGSNNRPCEWQWRCFSLRYTCQCQKDSSHCAVDDFRSAVDPLFKILGRYPAEAAKSKISKGLAVPGIQNAEVKTWGDFEVWGFWKSRKDEYGTWSSNCSEKSNN